MGVLGRAVLHVAVAGVHERRVCLRDGDDVGAHVAGDRLDVAGHRRPDRWPRLARVDFALAGWLITLVKEVPPVGEVVRRRQRGKGILGDRVWYRLNSGFAELAALILRVRRLVHVDVDDRRRS